MAGNFELKGFDKVVRFFSDMTKRVKDNTEINKTMAAMGFKNVMEHFEDEKDEYGRKWPRWIKKGQRYTARPTKRGGNKMLQDSGSMKNAVKFKATRSEAIVYIINKVAGFHHDGTKKMEKRRFMYIDNSMFERIANLYARYLVKK